MCHAVPNNIKMFIYDLIPVTFNINCSFQAAVQATLRHLLWRDPYWERQGLWPSVRPEK